MVKLYQITKEVGKVTALNTFVNYYKKVLIGIGILILLVLALMIFTDLLGTIKDSLRGVNRFSPTVAFGKLPQLDLSEGVKPDSDTIYKIETISGNLPTLDTVVKVFSVKKQVATFSDLEDSKNKARALVLKDVPIENFNGKVKFVGKDDDTKILTVETISQSFILDSNYLGDPDIISSKVSSEKTAINSALNFFQNIEAPISQFPEENIAIESYKIENGRLVQSISLSSSNLVKVIFGREDIEGLPVFNIFSESPSVWVLTTGEEVVAAEYNNYEIEKHKFSTYPLKSVEQAFKELANGEGILNRSLTSNVFEIRKVKLGYLESRPLDKYFQPVYVFESDNGLVAFIGAVIDDWVN